MRGSRLGRLPRGDALHDAPRPAVRFLDLHALRSQVLERLAGQVVGLEAQGKRFDQTLTCADDPRRAPYMFQEQHPPRRLEDPYALRYRPSVIRAGTQAPAEEHRVDPAIGEVTGL